MTRTISRRSKQNFRMSSALTMTLSAMVGVAAFPQLARAQAYDNFGSVASVGNLGGSNPTLPAGGAQTTLNIGLNAPSSVINWNSLSVNGGSTLNFDTTVGPASVLNRVIGTSQSHILGNIQTNGGAAAQANVTVWFVNRNGITYHENAAFNGGSLVLSSLDMNPTDFLNGNFRVNNGAVGNFVDMRDGTGRITAFNGPVIAVGSKILANKDISATGDSAINEVVLVAANDVQFSTVPGSPLTVTIKQGTPVGTAMSVGGVIDGQSVRVAAIGPANASDVLLNVGSDAQLTARAMNGVVTLATRADDASHLVVEPAVGGKITSTGSLVANNSGGQVRVLSAESAGVLGAVNSVGNYTVAATGDITLGGSSAVSQSTNGAISISTTTGSILQGGAGALSLQSNRENSTGGGITISTGTGNVALAQTSLLGGTPAAMSADIALNAGNGSVSFQSATSNLLTVAGKTGIVSSGTIRTRQSLVLETADADANISINNANTTGAASNITVNSAGGSTIVSGTVAATGDYIVQGGKGISLGGNSNVVQSAAGAVRITAATGDVAKAGSGTLVLNSDTNASGGDNLIISAVAGNIVLGSTDLAGGTSGAPVSSVSLTANNGSVLFNGASGDAVLVAAKTGIQSDGVIKSQQAINLTTSAAGANVTANSLETTTIGSDITVNSIAGTATVKGNVTSLGDYIVEGGTGILLGSTDGVTQQARGAVRMNALTGDIGQVGTNALTLISNSGLGTLQPLALTAQTGNIVLGATKFVGGSVAGRESNVSLLANAGSVTSGKVDANTLTVQAGNGITATGKLSANQSINLTSAGDVTARDIETFGAFADVTVNSTAGMARVDGNVSAKGQYVVEGATGVRLGNIPGSLQKADSRVAITAHGGNVVAAGAGLTLQSNAEKVGVETVSVRATAGDLQLTQATLVGGSIAERESGVQLVAGGNVGFGDVHASTLTVQAGTGITSPGAIKTSNALTLATTGVGANIDVTAIETTDAGSGISLDAQAGAVFVRGTVTSLGDYLVNGNTGVTLGTGASAITQKAAGQVSLTSAGNISSVGTLSLQANVNGAGAEKLVVNSSGGSINLSGSGLTGGSTGDRESVVQVLAGTGNVTLGSVVGNALFVRAGQAVSVSGAINTGNPARPADPVSGIFSVDIESAGGISLANVTADNADHDVRVVSTGGTVNAGIVTANRNVIVEGNSLTLTSATATTGNLSLTARNAHIALGTGFAGGIAQITAATAGNGDVTIVNRLDTVGDAKITSGAAVRVPVVSSTAGDVIINAGANVTGATVGARASLSAGGANKRVLVEASNGTVLLDSVNAGTGAGVLAGEQVRVVAHTLDVNSVNAANGDVTLVSGTGNLTAGSVNAGGGAILQSAALLQTDTAAARNGNLQVTAGGTISGATGARANLAAVGADKRVIVQSGGSVMLGTVTAGSGATTIPGEQIGVTGQSVDITSAVATNGALSIDATNGIARIANGAAQRGSANMSANGPVEVTGELSGSGLVSVIATGPAGSVTANRLISSANGITVAGNTGASVTFADANTSLGIASAQGNVVLGTGKAGTTATLSTLPGTGMVQVTQDLTSGQSATVNSGGNAELAKVTATTGNVTINALNGSVSGIGGARANLTATAGAVDVKAGPSALLGPVFSGGDFKVEANTVDVSSANVGGDLSLDTKAGNATLTTGTVTGASLVKASGDATIGTLNSVGAATLTAGGVASATLLKTSGATGKVIVSGARVNLTNVDSSAALTVTGAAGDVSIGTGKSAGVMTIKTTGVGASAGNISVATSLASGGATTIDSTGNASLATTTSVGAVDVKAVGGVQAASLTSTGAGGGITVSSGNANLTAVEAAGALSVTAINGAIVIGTGKAGTTAGLKTDAPNGTDVTVSTSLNSGQASTITSRGNARLAAVTATTGDVVVNAVNGEVTGVGVAAANLEATGGKVTLNGGTLARLGIVKSGGDTGLTADSITVATANVGGALSLDADVGNATLGTGTVTGTSLIKATGDASVGSLTSGGPSTLTAGGLASATTLLKTTGAAGNILVSGATVQLAKVESAAGLTSTASGGNLTVNEGTSVGAVSLKTTGTGASAGDVIIGTTLSSGGTTMIDSTRDATLASTTSAGAVTVTAVGATMATLLKSNAAITATSGSMNLTNVDAGSALSLTSNNGALTVATGKSGTTSELKSGAAGGTDVSVTTALTSGQGTTITSRGNARLASVTATTGDMVVNALTGEVTGVGAGAANLEATAGKVTVNGGALARLGTVKSGSDLSVTADAINVASANVSGAMSLIADVGNALLDTGIVTGTSLLQAPGNVTVGNLQSGGTATLSAGGTASATTIVQTTSAGAAINVTGGTLDLTEIDSKAGLALEATAGDLKIGRATAAGNLSLTTSGTGANAGDIQADNLTTTFASGGTTTINSSRDVRLGLAVSSGAMKIDSVGSTRATNLQTTVAGSGITVTAGSANLTGVDSAGALALTANNGALIVDIAKAATTAELKTIAPGGTDVTVNTSLTSGQAATVTSRGNARLSDVKATTGDVIISAANGEVTGVGAGAAKLTAVTGKIDVTGGTLARLGDVDSKLDLKVAADTISVNKAIVGGNLTLDADAGNVILGTGTVTGSSTIKTTGAGASAGDVTIGTTLSSGGATTINSTRDAALASTTSTGPITVTAVGATTAALLKSNAAITATSGSMNLTNVDTGSALSLTSNNGALTVATGKSGTTSELKTVAAGGTDVSVTTSLTSGQGTTITSRGNARLASVTATTDDVTIKAVNGEVTGIGADGANFSATVGKVIVEAGSLARLKTVTSGNETSVKADNITVTSGGQIKAVGQTITLTAKDASIGGVVEGTTINIVNPSASTAPLVLGGTGSVAGAFTLEQSELDQLRATNLNFDATSATAATNAKNIEIRSASFGTQSGSSAINFLTRGRIDVTGTVKADNSSADRVIRFGGTATTVDDKAAAIVVTTSADGVSGGRILMESAKVEMRGIRIGAGLENKFLGDLGLTTSGTPLGSLDVSRRYIGNPASTLYNAGALGGGGYTGATDTRTILSARVLTLRVGDYALFQNTGVVGLNAGVKLGTLSTTTNALTASGGLTPAQAGGIAMYGSINGIENSATALLGADVISVTAVDPANTRINGCLIGGGRCLSTTIPLPVIGVFDYSRADIFKSATDFEIPFDPIVGTNNESLFGDVGTFGLEEIPLNLQPECDPSKGGNCPTAQEPK